MSLVTLIILVSIIASVVELIKKPSDKRGLISTIKEIGSKVSLENYIDKEAFNDLFGTDHKRPIENNRAKKPIKVETRIEKVEKPRKNPAKDSFKKEPIKEPILEEASQINPFELTDNPITNAIIASEILGEPKCRR